MSGKLVHQTDAFENSIYFKLLQEAKNKHAPLRIAFLEYIEYGTELQTIIKKLKNAGYVILLNIEKYVESELHNEAEGVAESMALHASLRQANGEFLLLDEYTQKLKEKSVHWRAAMMQMFARLKKESFVSGLEDIEEVGSDTKDSISPDFRFVLHFNKNTMGDDEHYAKAQRECIEEIQKFQHVYAEKFNNLNGQTESEEFLRTIIDMRVGQNSNPEKGELNVVITPNRILKDFFTSFMIGETCRKLGITRSGLDHILICADTSANLHTGYESIRVLADPDDPAQLVPQATFFIPRTTSYTTVLRRLQNAVEGVREEQNAILKSHVLPISLSHNSGHYIYQPVRDNPALDKLRRKVAEEKQNSDSVTRTHHYPTAEIIVADEAYATALTPVESVLMYLNEKYPNN